MEYVFKVSAIVTIFYLVYRLFLQKETFFNISRWFLILGILMSFVLPLIVIPVYHEYTSVEVPVAMFNGTQEQTNMVPITEPFDILDYLPIVYGIGISFFSIQFFIRLFSLFKVINKNKSHKKGGYIFIETTDELSPFSFFKWIVYNPNQFKTSEISQIIAHEKAHAKQYHSIDILLMEICCILLWFHPLVWLYNKSVKQNLEFLADKYALYQFNDTKSYQYTLLKAGVPNHQVALSNHFYNSLIKKRIAMLQKSRSKKINLLKYALVVPVLTLFLMSFNTEDVYVERMVENQKGLVKKSIALMVRIDKDTKDEELDRFKTSFNTKFNMEINYTSIKRNIKDEITYIKIDLKIDGGNLTTTHKGDKKGEAIKSFGLQYNDVKKAMDVTSLKDEENDYRVNPNIIPFVPVYPKDVSIEEYNRLTSPKNIVDVSIFVKGTDTLAAFTIKNIDTLKDEIKKEVKIIINKNTTDSELKEHQDFFKEKYNLDFNYKNIERNLNNELKSIIVELLEESVKVVSSQKTNNAINPIVVEYNHDTKEMKTYRLKNLNVKADNIAITSKNNQQKVNNPIYIVDGKEVSNAAFKKINQEDIYAINVLKDKTATDKYGAKGKEGVVEIIKTEKENEIKILFDKDTSDKELEKYKERFRVKFNKDLKYKVERNSKGEIVFFKFDFPEKGFIGTDVNKEKKEPIKRMLIVCNRDNNTFNVVEYN